MPKRIAIGLRGGISKIINDQSIIKKGLQEEYCDFIACYNSFKYNIIEANPDYIFDIFIHCWNPELEESICKLYNPVSYCFEDNSKYKIEIKRRCKKDSDFAGISQSLSIKKVIRLIEKFSEEKNIEYDKILIYRPDLLLFKKMNLSIYDISKGIYVNNYNNCRGDFYFILSQINMSNFKYLYHSALFGNTHEVHSWIRKYITEYMKCNIFQDTIESGKDIEVIRKVEDKKLIEIYKNNKISNNITFFILHHAETEVHVYLLYRCLESIRKIYKDNKIIICKTSITNIHEQFINNYNIEIINTEVDGSTIWGGLCKLVERNDIDNYIIMHDSMVLLKKIPDTIINKKLYYIWHFLENREDDREMIIEFLKHSNLSYIDQYEIYKMYDTYTGWTGCFGPVFGGKRESLISIVNALNLKENCHIYNKKRNLQCAERFLAVLFHYFKVFEECDTGISLCGEIHKQPLAFAAHINTLTLDCIYTIPYDGYFFKTWAVRH